MTSPFLIFLLNFSDQEFVALETYLECLHKNNETALIPIPFIKIHSSEASISNKRLDLYLKGGVFSVTYKILVLDLLTKRLSPSIISGLIINNAH
jgi:DNA excision repair protein ERCC-4